MNSMQQTLLNEVEVAKICGINVGTLQQWRKQRRVLPFVRLGRRLVRYRPDDLQAYFEKHTVPTGVGKEGDMRRVEPAASNRAKASGV